MGPKVTSNIILDLIFIMGYSGNMKYISIYQTYRERGGSEEGGWYYTVREKFRDLKKSFASTTEVYKWWDRILKATANDSNRHDRKLEVHLFEDKHGPEDHSDPSSYS